MNIISKFISVNFTNGRQGHAVKQITPHTAVSGARSLFGWFNNSKAQASTHFYVNNLGEIEQYVGEENTSWANSNWGRNIESVTFETWDNGNPNDSVRTNELYESSAQLVAYLSKKYDIPLVLLSKDQSLAGQKGITLHRYFANKSCPAELDVQRIINRAKEILSITGQPMPTFNFELYLKDNNLFMRVLSGSINGKATVKNLTKGTSWEVNCVKSVGNDGNAINFGMEACLYEVVALGVVRQFDNRPVTPPTDPCANVKAELETAKKTIAERDGTIVSLQKQVADLTAQVNLFVPETIYRKK